MALLMEADEGASHRNDIVIGVWGEDDHPLAGRVFSLRVAGNQLGGFTAGPSGDGIPHAVEDADIDVVRITIHDEQVAQTKIIVIIVRQHQHRLVKGQGHITDRLPDHLFCPADLSGQPG